MNTDGPQAQNALVQLKVPVKEIPTLSPSVRTYHHASRNSAVEMVLFFFFLLFV